MAWLGVSAQGRARLKVSSGWDGAPAGALGPLQAHSAC